MDSKVIVAVVSTIIMIFGSGWYVWQAILDKKVKPVLASWIILSVTLTLSFATYWTTKKHSLIGNIGGLASAGTAIPILLVLTVLHIKRGKKLLLNKFQKFCLCVSAAIAALWVVIVWGLGLTGDIPFWMTQVLMLIGYSVTAQKFRLAKSNSESLMTWGCISLSTGMAFYISYATGQNLAMFSNARGAVCAAILALLARRAERRALELAKIQVVATSV